MYQRYEPEKFMGCALLVPSAVVMMPFALIGGCIAAIAGSSFSETCEEILEAGVSLVTEFGDKNGGKIALWVVRGAAITLGADIGDAAINLLSSGD